LSPRALGLNILVFSLSIYLPLPTDALKRQHMYPKRQRRYQKRLKAIMERMAREDTQITYSYLALLVVALISFALIYFYA
jgi:hypothetical protein